MSKFRQYDNYEVYEDGKIWSYKTKKFLKPRTVQGGYKQVVLYDNEGNRKSYLLHRLVYETFSCEPIPLGMQCNHISEDKTDCSFSNINLLSPKQNCNFGSRNKRLSKANTNNPKLSKAVGAFKDGNLVMTFPSTSEAERNGFDHSTVSACCRNCYMREGNNKYKGYTWKYL